MKVTMFWQDGSSYACFDLHNPEHAERFNSLSAAKRAFAARANDSYYPCVNEVTPDEGGPEAWVFYGHGPVGEYPDLLLHFGRRSGVVVERA